MMSFHDKSVMFFVAAVVAVVADVVVDDDLRFFVRTVGPLIRVQCDNLR